MPRHHRDGVAILGDSPHSPGLTTLALQNEREVYLYTGQESAPEGTEGVRFVQDLTEITRECSLMVLMVPARQVRPLVRALSPTLDGSQMLIHSVRGFEPGAATSISRLIGQECCVRKVGALLGPAFVQTLDPGMPNAAVIASQFSEVIRHTQRAFARPTMRVYSNPDLLGVEVSCAAAGCLALSVGLCLEMNLGPSTLAMLITRGVAELTRLVVALGGDHRTCSGLAGLGDLLVQREVESREVQIGRQLTRGVALDALRQSLGHSDALDAIPALVQLAVDHEVEANIIPTIGQLLDGRLDAAGALRQLMTLQQMRE